MTRVELVVLLVHMIGLAYSLAYNLIVINQKHKKRREEEKKRQQATKHQPKVKFGYFKDK